MQFNVSINLTVPGTVQLWNKQNDLCGWFSLHNGAVFTKLYTMRIDCLIFILFTADVVLSVSNAHSIDRNGNDTK